MSAKERAQKILQRQKLFDSLREYIYGALFCLMAVFGFMLESDGGVELVIGVIGMLVTVLVALMIRYLEEEA